MALDHVAPPSEEMTIPPNSPGESAVPATQRPAELQVTPG